MLSIFIGFMVGCFRRRVSFSSYSKSCELLMQFGWSLKNVSGVILKLLLELVVGVCFNIWVGCFLSSKEKMNA